MFFARLLWASPYTLVGLVIGGTGMCFGGGARIRGRAVEFYGGGTKWFVQHLPHGQFTLALTLGHTILGQTEASLDIARMHETVHVLQYERWGPFLLPCLNLLLENGVIVSRTCSGVESLSTSRALLDHGVDVSSEDHCRLTSGIGGDDLCVSARDYFAGRLYNDVIVFNRGQATVYGHKENREIQDEQAKRE